jgi:hypothetical protein
MPELDDLRRVVERCSGRTTAWGEDDDGDDEPRSVSAPGDGLAPVEPLARGTLFLETASISTSLAHTAGASSVAWGRYARVACASVARPVDASQRGDLRIVNGRKRAMMPAVASWKSKGMRQACGKLTSAGLRPIRSACVVGVGMSE